MSEFAPTIAADPDSDLDLDSQESGLVEAGLDADVDLDEATEEPDGSANEAGSAAAKDSKASVNTRALIRRTANKAEEIAEADAVIRSVAASLLGASSERLADLTTAIMTADRGVTQPIADLYKVAESDPFSAATVVGALGRDRMKAVWKLLDDFDAAPAGQMNASNAKAALDLAKHVLTAVNIEDLRPNLDAVTELLRKN